MAFSNLTLVILLVDILLRTCVSSPPVQPHLFGLRKSPISIYVFQVRAYLAARATPDARNLGATVGGGKASILSTILIDQ